jgi:hypothetical protein
MLFDSVFGGLFFFIAGTRRAQFPVLWPGLVSLNAIDILGCCLPKWLAFRCRRTGWMWSAMIGIEKSNATYCICL